jgi:hypothetical protein
MRIYVKDLVGELAVTAADGEKLLHATLAALESPGGVDIDFSGVTIVVSAFLNQGVARLIEAHSISELKERVRYYGLPDGGVDVLNRVLANAREYYRDGSRRAAVDSLRDDLFADVG